MASYLTWMLVGVLVGVKMAFAQVPQLPSGAAVGVSFLVPNPRTSY